MANDIRMQDPRLRDPINNISDGLKDPAQQQKVPGFFQSLRSPADLLLEESLPASLYQWMTGNTKKKQAQEALKFIQDNPRLAGTPIYKEAERKLNRFGYLLENDGPQDVDLKEVINLAKKSPGMFGAELVNMMVADPWLLFMPLGWVKLGKGVVNSLRYKYSKNFKYEKIAKTTANISAAAHVKQMAKLREAARSDIKIGSVATLGVPLVFSMSYQLGENAQFSGKRLAAETTIGATAGALFSVGFAGMKGIFGKGTGLPDEKLANLIRQRMNRYKTPDEALDYNENTGNFRLSDDIVKDIKKEVGLILDEDEFIKIARESTVTTRRTMETAKDMAVNTLFKTASAGGIVGTAQFLTADDDKLLATAKGFALGSIAYGGYKLATMFRQQARSWRNAELETEGILEAQNRIVVKYNSLAQELSNRIKYVIPDALDSRRKIFYYLTKARVDEKFRFGTTQPFQRGWLTKAERAAADEIRKVFDDFYTIFNKEGEGLVKYKKSNYLPLMWEGFKGQSGELFSWTNKFETQVTGQSPTFRFSRSRVFDDINQGLEYGYKLKPGADDPAELLRLYVQAAGKAMTTRQVLRALENSYVGTGYKPFLVRSSAAASHIHPSEKVNYITFDHPYFMGEKGFKPLIHKSMEKSLRMVYDATTEPQLMAALFTTNLMMKRLAVGFSFFHAGALVESLWFAGTNLRTIGKFLNPRTKPELLKMLNDPAYTLKEFPHAIEQLRRAGYQDAVRFAQGSGLQISIPEDVGYDRFYNNIRGVDQFLKRHMGVYNKPYIENTFKWFDRITWDRIFTSAKLHTFLTVLNRNNLKGVPNKLQIQPGVDIPTIFRKANKAAAFTNDAFGGQNWAKLTAEIESKFIKKLAQTTLNPGSRGYMQLLLFAPDWTISNIRIIAKSLPLFESDPGLRRMYQYYFARAALTYATIGSALNYIFSGHSILENTDPTRIDLGDGEVLTFSKQLMEPFHWITAPQSTALKKIGSLPRTAIEVLTNKQYLTTKWSPNMTKKDDEAIEKGLKIGGHVGMRFLPIWLQQASKSIAEGLQRDGLSLDLASDTAVDFVLGQLGHPRYKGPRYTQYKTKGLVRSPYETLF